MSCLWIVNSPKILLATGIRRKVTTLIIIIILEAHFQLLVVFLLPQIRLILIL